MKKMIEIFVVLLLCCILVMPTNAVDPSMTATTRTINRTLNPGDIFILTITYGPWGYFPDWPNPPFMMWDLEINWDAQYLDLLDYSILSYRGLPNHCWDGISSHMNCEETGIYNYELRNEDTKNVDTLTFRIKKSTPYRTNTIINIWGQFWGRDSGDTDTGPGSSTSFEIPYNVYVPEYPSPYIPATMIIGFLGAVLLIQRIRKH